MSEQHWSQHFLDTGEIRLASFAALRTHADETRADRLEAFLQFEHEAPGADGCIEFIWATADWGPRAYVLCTSISDTGEIARSFNANSYVAIQNTTGFADAIARQIPGFVEGSEGPCLYTEGRTIRRDLGPLPPELRQFQGQRMHGPMHPLIAQAIGDAPYYLKAPKFAWQLEYRFVWVTDHEVDGHLVVRAPDARRFCSRRTTHAGFAGSP